MSQSPFIFANLIMDTNAYDVNVSPDKRTIMLHDQTALLESIKESLSTLFEGQDQTIPTSQLQSHNRKLPDFRPPTMIRDQTSAGSIPGEAEPDSPAVADVEARQSQRPSRNGLIHDWVGRDAESRMGTAQAPDDQVASALKGKLKLLPKFARQDEDRRASSEEPVCPERTSSADVDSPHPCELGASDSIAPRETSYSITRDAHPPKSVQTPQRFTTETVRLEDDSDISNGASPVSSDEENIPSVRPATQKAAPGPVQNAFDRMRPKRVAEELATVTVGGRTTTMVLAGPESKRRRIHTPKMSGKNSSATGFVSSLRMFAAPGSQMPESDDAQDDEADEAERASADGTIEGDGSDVSDAETSSAEAGQNTGTMVNATPSRGRPTERAADDESQSSGDGLFVEPSNSGDDSYLDEDDKKALEERRVAKLIQEAEDAAARPTEETLRRANQMFKGINTRRKDATLNLTQILTTSMDELRRSSVLMPETISTRDQTATREEGDAESLDSQSAEAKLSLTISKPDFAEMRIVGQFNLGFILAIRPADTTHASHGSGDEDHLFIIDQHAADEKFNFERLSATTTLTPQRLVTPHELQLSAVEEELILANKASLIANGFEIEVQDSTSHLTNQPQDATDDTGQDDLSSIPFSATTPRGRRFNLLTLPTSKETTFSTSDLEELLHLLSESSTSNSASLSSHSSLSHSTIPRPSKVRRMLAMRACRSSIMVGKNLTSAQMGKVVGHMGMMERPWNCPHGRPTMRHLAGLGGWRGWDGDGGSVDWKGFRVG